MVPRPLAAKALCTSAVKADAEDDLRSLLRRCSNTCSAPEAPRTKLLSRRNAPSSRRALIIHACLCCFPRVLPEAGRLGDDPLVVEWTTGVAGDNGVVKAAVLDGDPADFRRSEDGANDERGSKLGGRGISICWTTCSITGRLPETNGRCASKVLSMDAAALPAFGLSGLFIGDASTG